MKKRVQRTRKLAPGIHGSRRPKKGLSKQITFWVSEEEKQRIEQAADGRRLEHEPVRYGESPQGGEEGSFPELRTPSRKSQPTSVRPTVQNPTVTDP